MVVPGLLYDFRQKVKDEMDERNWTAEELADAIDFPEEDVELLLSGAIPGEELVEEICDLFTWSRPEQYSIYWVVLR